MNDTSFEDWWNRINEMADAQMQRGINPIIILGLEHFGTIGTNVSLMTLTPIRLLPYCLAAQLWAMAGARGFSLSALIPRG